MKITVKNFGPIRGAEDIEISPLTLFVGPSNTGKSYLAVLIYSIFNVLTNNTWPISSRRIQRDSATLQEEKRYNTDVERLRTALSEDSTDPAEMQQIAEELTESAFFVWTSYIRKSLRNQILYCFGEEGKNLLKDEEISIILSPSNEKILVNIISSSESKMLNETKEIISGKLIRLAKQYMPELVDKDLYSPRMIFNDFFIEQFTSLLWKKIAIYVIVTICRLFAGESCRVTVRW